MTTNEDNIYESAAKVASFLRQESIYTSAAEVARFFDDEVKVETTPRAPRAACERVRVYLASIETLDDGDVADGGSD